MIASRAFRTALLASALVVPLSGCASAGHFLARLIGHRPPAMQAEARPVYKGAISAPALTPTDRLYEAAAEKIEARDYAAALDLLQFAKEATPDDVRVLNAMGVVYDKLGRFDLSDRYYALALVSEPGSRVVAANVRYSELLRRAMATTRSAALISPPAIMFAMQDSPAPIPSPLSAASGLRQIPLGARPFQVGAQPSGLRLAVATGTVRRVAPLTVGSALALVNATGRASAAQPARVYLAQAGWSLAAADGVEPAQARSEIRFPTRSRAVAEALARTLPFKAVLAACPGECGLQLVLGRDAPERLAAGRAG